MVSMGRIRNEYIRWTAQVGRFGGKLRETRLGGFDVYGLPTEER